MGILIPLLGGASVFLVVFAIAVAWGNISERGEDVTVRGVPFGDSALGKIVRWRSTKNSESVMWSAYGSRLDRKLLLAGRPMNGISGESYLSVSQLSILVGLLVIIALLIFAGVGVVGSIVLGFIISSVSAFLVFESVDNLVADRRTQISRTFPYFLDLCVMTMEAGTSFVESVEIYVTDIPKNAFVEESDLLLKEIKLGRTLQESITNMADRISAEEVQTTLRALLQGQRMGTPLGEVLREQAEGIRFKRSQLAERAAEEIKVRMQGPAMLLMVAVLLLILGPAILQMAGSGVI